jgi:hypothetical protein
VLPLILSLILETGYLPAGTYHAYQPRSEFAIEDLCFYGDVTTRAELWGIFAEVSCRDIVMKAENGFQFIPTTAQYIFSIGWEGGPLSVGFRQYCIHPIAAGLGVGRGVLNYDAAYQELYARLELEWRPFE